MIIQYSVHLIIEQFKVMGNNCSNFQLKDQYQFLYQLLSPTFGPLKLMRNDKTGKDIALKYFNFTSQADLKHYMAIAKNAESYIKIPTLVKILTCTEDDKPSCQSFGCYLSFQYFKKTLDDVLREKKMNLSEFLVINRNDKEYKSLNHLKFYDYERMDRTTLVQRKYCNIHFLEVEVLRMIDHVVGAAFFLYHVNQQQNSIRPENILIDEEGKHLLVDKQLFRLKTNYELSIHSYKNVPYLSPQELKHLKTKAIQKDVSSELSDIFSIGMIALEMCTLDSLNGLYDFETMRLNVLELNRLLSNARQHYSSDFMNILERMLKMEEHERVDFSTLIDILSPVITRNVNNHNKVYGANWAKDSDALSCKANEDRISDLQKRLEEVDAKYDKVMGAKVVQKPYHLKPEHYEKDEQAILSRLKQAKKQRQRNQEMKGSDIYDMFVREYNSISQSRVKPKRRE